MRNVCRNSKVRQPGHNSSSGCFRSSHQPHEGGLPTYVSRGFSGRLAAEAEGLMERRWNDSTSRVLDRHKLVVGSFDTLKWQLAQTLILYWTQQGEKGVDISFQLLDRLIDEAAANSHQKLTIDVYLLHAILKNWKTCFRNFQVDLLPSTIVTKLDEYQAKSPECLRPNIATYTMILDGASCCSNPAERLVFTEKLLERLLLESESNPSVRPTVVTFCTVIIAWARAGNVTFAQKAEDLFRRIQLLHSRGWPDVKPNGVIYTAVISGWANVGDANRAERLLREMYQLYALEGDLDVRPNLSAFNKVLFAWAKSPEPNAVESAEAILNMMKEQYSKGTLESKPDVLSYNIVMSMLLRKRNLPETLSKAESLVKEMVDQSHEGNQAAQPNSSSFEMLFKVLAASQQPDSLQRAKYWLEIMNQMNIPPDAFIQNQIRRLEDQDSSKASSNASQPDDKKY